jgi:hypothetical protein
MVPTMFVCITEMTLAIFIAVCLLTAGGKLIFNCFHNTPFIIHVFQIFFVGRSMTRAKLPYRKNKEWESFSRQQSDYQRNFLIISHGHSITNSCTETDKIMKERKGLSPKQVLS